MPYFLFRKEKSGSDRENIGRPGTSALSEGLGGFLKNPKGDSGKNARASPLGERERKEQNN